MKIHFKSVMTFCIFLVSFNALAETAICNGKIEKIAYHQPDGFYLKISDSGIMKVCSPQAQYFRTGPESCDLIISLATAARIAGKTVQIYVDNAPSTICSEIPNWHGADIRFFQLVD